MGEGGGSDLPRRGAARQRDRHPHQSRARLAHRWRGGPAAHRAAGREGAGARITPSSGAVLLPRVHRRSIADRVEILLARSPSVARPNIAVRADP